MVASGTKSAAALGFWLEQLNSGERFRTILFIMNKGIKIIYQVDKKGFLFTYKEQRFAQDADKT